MHVKATNKEPALWHKLSYQIECQHSMMIPAQMPAPNDNPGCCTCSLVPVLGHLQRQHKMAQVPLTLETWLECRLLVLTHSCSRLQGKLSFSGCLCLSNSLINEIKSPNKTHTRHYFIDVTKTERTDIMRCSWSAVSKHAQWLAPTYAAAAAGDLLMTLTLKYSFAVSYAASKHFYVTHNSISRYLPKRNKHTRPHKKK